MMRRRRMVIIIIITSIIIICVFIVVHVSVIFASIPQKVWKLGLWTMIFNKIFWGTCLSLSCLRTTINPPPKLRLKHSNKTWNNEYTSQTHNFETTITWISCAKTSKHPSLYPFVSWSSGMNFEFFPHFKPTTMGQLGTSRTSKSSGCLAKMERWQHHNIRT